MSVIATDSTRFSAVVKKEYAPEFSYCREVVTLNDTAGVVYKVGAVLGKVTATSKYKLAASAAGDGSQTPAALLIMDGLGQSFDVTATGSDQKVVVLVRGPAIVADAGLQLGVGTTSGAVKTAFAALNPPILVETAV